MNLISKRKDNWFPALFEDLFSDSRLADINFGNTLPAVNIKENADGFEVALAVPGKQKEDFSINLEDNLLTVAAAREEKNETSSEDGQYTRKEFAYEAFERSFHLPDTVAQDKIEATYTNGILQVWVPKKEETKEAKRMIAVS